MCCVAMVRADCNADCPRDRSPICAVRYYNNQIEFKTHSNACLLNFYNCENPSKGTNNVISVLNNLQYIFCDS